MQNKQCWLCGRTNGFLDKHHIFGGNNRKKSQKYKLTVYLCHESCHIFGENAVHNNAGTMQKLHEYGQRKFMEEQGADIAGFVRVFGKNYIDEEW